MNLSSDHGPLGVVGQETIYCVQYFDVRPGSNYLRGNNWVGVGAMRAPAT
jgi:hypothetical protein